LGQKSEEFFSLLFTVTSKLTYFTFPPLSKSDLKLVCNANIIYENLESENSQDYAQKPPNCKFMNSASGQSQQYYFLALYCAERTLQTGYNLSILESTVRLTFGEERGNIYFSCVAKSMAKIS
jgi:hypothetical protein